MTQLKIDLDRKWTICHWQRWSRRAAECLEYLELVPESVEVRQTRRGIHVIMNVPGKVPDLEVVAVQAILGSDSVREAWNLRRVQRGEKNWNWLSEVKKKRGEPMYQVKARPDWGVMLARELKHLNPGVCVVQTNIPPL